MAHTNSMKPVMSATNSVVPTGTTITAVTVPVTTKRSSISTVEWTKVKTLALIEDYRGYPVLWDPKLFDANILKQKRDAALSVLCAKYKCTIEELNRKIYGLRSQFHRERNKIRNINKKDEIQHTQGGNNQSQTQQYIPKWFAYNALQFILTDTNEAEKRKLDSSSDNEEDSPKKMCLPNSTTTITTTTTTGASNTTNAERDEYTIYGEHVAIQLRNLNNRQVFFVAQHKINEIIFDAQMGNYTNCINVPETTLPSALMEDPSSTTWSSTSNTLPSPSSRSSPPTTSYYPSPTIIKIEQYDSDDECSFQSSDQFKYDIIEHEIKYANM